MYFINQITSDPLQNMTIILPNGNPCSLTINYVERQLGWFIVNLTYAPSSFILNGMRICNNPNLLYPWKNVLPFGLACYTKQSREPTQIQDFSSGASNLYILDASEVEELTQFYESG